jgi:cytochrome c peroxidase
MASLEDQIRKSIATTMIGPELTNEQIVALAAYLRTLSPAPALGPISNRGNRDEVAAAVERGRQHFAAWKCARCHAEPSYTSEGTYNVGLEDEVGNQEFNPPSLRGVSQRDRLFHDNRAGSLEEVFSKFRHQVPEGAAPKEVEDLIEFLRGL